MGPKEGGATAARAHPLTAISLLLSASCNRSVASLVVYGFLQNKMYALHSRSWGTFLKLALVLTLRSNLVHEMKVVASVDPIWCLCSPPFQHVALWNFPSSTCLVCCDCCIVSIAVCRPSVSNSISLHPLLYLPQMVKWATDQWGVDDVCGNNWAPPFLGWRACLPPPHRIPHWTTKTRI